MIQQTVREMRESLIRDLAVYVNEAALDSEPGNRTEESYYAFAKVLGAYEDIAKLTSTSSHPSYALRDLPASEAASYKKAKHGISILGHLYGPKDASE